MKNHFILICCLSFLSLAMATHPNVILVITDDQGYGDLACHGNEIIKTPSLDKLHSESLRFTDFHVSSTCAPTRGALMSGHWTNRAGPWHTIMGRSMLFQGEKTLAEVFGENGYASGHFGKWHLGDNYPYRPEDRGFDEVVRHGGGGVGQTPDYWNNSYFDDTYFHNGVPRKYEGYCTDIFFNEAKSFMKAQLELGKPFFTYISTNAPHSPMVCDEKYWKHYTQAPYNLPVKEAIFYGMIENIDENVGSLRQWLVETGLDENTIFIFMTDNGSANGSKIFNAGMRGAKASSYDGGHRVPFFVKLPKSTQAADIEQLSAHVDVLPTLVDLCGLKPIESDYKLDGINLTPWIKDINTPQNIDRVVITDTQRVVDPVKWKDATVMTKQWRLITNGDKRELYDILADPGQLNDIATVHPEVVKQLEQNYEDWWQDISPALAKTSRIPVGVPHIEIVDLTAHDVIPPKGAPAWNQSQVRKGRFVNGIWALDIKQAGEYEIKVSRWPIESGLKMREGTSKGKETPGLGSYAEVEGIALDIAKVSIDIAENKQLVAIDEQSKFATFKVLLPQGEFDLSANFILDNGKEIGVGYAYVKKID